MFLSKEIGFVEIEPRVHSNIRSKKNDAFVMLISNLDSAKKDLDVQTDTSISTKPSVHNGLVKTNATRRLIVLRHIHIPQGGNYFIGKKSTSKQKKKNGL